MADAREPHPKNAPGPFCVVDGCCLSCAVWTSVAPNLFAFDDSHCYVKRQPHTLMEMDQMLVALWAAEVSCIRYRGNDPAIFERLGAMGKPELCDSPPPKGIPVVLRNHVVLESVDPSFHGPAEAVADFRSYFLEKNAFLQSDVRKFRSPAHGRLDRPIWFAFAWFEERFHRVCVSTIDRDGRRVLMSHSPTATSASRGISNQLSEWLAQSKRFGNQRWYTAEQWAQQTEGSPTPW